MWRCGPACVLLLALATVFLFGPDRRYFYSTGGVQGGGLKKYETHDIVSSHHMAVARNLTAEHNFLGFYRLTLTQDRELTYEPYNRFPVGGHVLIKLVTLPFSDDLAAALRAARLLMLAFWAGAALLAYLSLSRLTASRRAAIGATLLAFASHPVLFYHDMVATEGTLDLFGMLLVFHGIAVFSAPPVGERTGPVPVPAGAGFGQLLAKTCGALLLGWYVYALLLPFVMLGLAGALACRWKGQIDWTAVRRHLTLGAGALGFGLAVLGFNFAREYFALGGERPLAELPSVGSMLFRTGITRFAFSGDWTWGWTVPLLGEQFRRVGEALVPAAWTSCFSERLLIGFGVAVPACIVGLLCLRSPPSRLPLAALALSGFCWALPMFNFVRYHEYYGMFYLCVPLVFFSLVPLHLKACVRRIYDPKPSPVQGSGGRRRAWAVRPATGWAVAASTIFAVSGWVVGQDKREAQDVEVERALTADLHAIRPLVKNKVVFFPRLWFRLMWTARMLYSLTGSVVIWRDLEFADFVVAFRLEGADSVTPENSHVFLYRPAAVDAVRLSYERRTQTLQPIIASTWDVYHMRNALLYAGEGAECTNPEPPQFFLHTYPVHPDDLPPRHRRGGFDRWYIERDFGWQRDGKCYILAWLPTYEIAEIHTGQHVRGPYRRLWEGYYSPLRTDGENRS